MRRVHRATNHNLPARRASILFPQDRFFRDGILFFAVPSTSRFGADFLFSAAKCFLWSSPNEIKGVSFRRGNGGSDWGRSPTPPRIALDRDGVIRGAGSRRATQEGRWLQTSYLQAARVSGGLTVAVSCVVGQCTGGGFFRSAVRRFYTNFTQTRCYI